VGVQETSKKLGASDLHRESSSREKACNPAVLTGKIRECVGRGKSAHSLPMFLYEICIFKETFHTTMEN
jgi:hypothetical protein